MKQRIERLMLRGPLVLGQSLHSAATLLKGRAGLAVQPSVYFVVPQANWVVDWIGKHVTEEIRAQFGASARLTFTAAGIRGQILHYGALGSFVSSLSRPWNAHNRVIATIFHGDRQYGNSSTDEPQLTEHVEQLIAHAAETERIVTACSIMAQRLRAWGIPAQKVAQIPLGIELSHFTPAEPEQRHALRRRLGIPEDAVCIGSFQKDGVGWGAGNEPKRVKGPDVFLEVVARLRERYPIFVLLTGPARGFVTGGLDAMGVPYRHDVLENFLDIVDYYRCLDLYLVTAREEGGPKAVLESLATGVPLVSTRVGMAPDVIESGVNGLLADVEDVPGLVAAAEQMLDDTALRERCINNGLQTVRAYDWPAIARRYWEEVYAPLVGGSLRNPGQP